MSAVTDVLSVNLKPMSDPDRFEVKAVGAGAMRVHLTIDRAAGQGQFATLFHYIDDLIAAVAKNQPDLQKLRVLPKFVASFAARDSFYIDVMGLTVLRSEQSAGDLVVHQENLEGKRCLRLTLTHYAFDVLRDVIDLLETATRFSPKEKA